MFNKKELKRLRRDVDNLFTLFDDMMKHNMILKDKVKVIDDEVFDVSVRNEVKKSKLYYLAADVYALKNYLDVEIKWHHEDNPKYGKLKVPQMVVWEATKRVKKDEYTTT